MTIECLGERELLADLILQVEQDITGTKRLLKICRAEYVEDQEYIAELDEDLERLTKQKKLLETYLEKL